MIVRIVRVLSVFLSFFFFSLNVSGQDVPVVKKSTKIEIYKGNSYYIHVVEPKQTLYSIARVYSTPISDLMKVNPGLSAELTPGQIIKIPVEKGEAPELKILSAPDYDTAAFQKHYVAKGETLYRLSRQYGVSIAAIQGANDGLPGGLKAGTFLLIPRKATQPTVVNAPEMKVEVEKPHREKERQTVKVGSVLKEKEDVVSTDTAFIYHRVKRRETLYGISRRYRVSMDRIIEMNPLLKSRKLHRGDRLRIPQTKEVIRQPSPNEKPLSFVAHTVRKGETLWSIAKQYDVDVEDILLLNPQAQKGIKRRRKLKIPVFPKEEEPVAEEVRKEVVEIEAGNTVVKITEELAECVGRAHQEEFRIALLLPFYLEELNLEDYGQSRSRRFLDFYKGIRMATDSLARRGMKIRLDVYDVDDDLQKVEEALNAPGLKQSDLIIGPLFRRVFPRVMNFAHANHIPIVNPFTPQVDFVRDNPEVFKVQVPENIHLKLIAHSIRKHYPESNIILVRERAYQDGERVAAIKEALQGKLKDRVLLPNSYLYNLLVEKSYGDTTIEAGELFDTIYIENRMFKEDFLSDEIMAYTIFPNPIHELVYEDDSLHGLSRYASLARRNIFVSLTDEKSFSMELLSRLNSLKDTFDISVYMLPGALTYALEADFLAGLDVHVSGSGYLDFGTPYMSAFEEAYLNRWGHYPHNQMYACMAYDLGMYFGSALYSFGRDFGHCLPNHPYEGLFFNFFFVGKPGNGYENGYASIYRFYDFHFVPEEKLRYTIGVEP